MPHQPKIKAIADAYGNKFIIPLDFEMLDSAAPYYQTVVLSVIPTVKTCFSKLLILYMK